MRLEHSGNAAATTLAAALDSTTQTFTVADPTGWPTGATAPFVVTLDRGTSSEEKLLCASRSGNLITVTTRGFDSTVNTSHASGASAEHTYSATEAEEANAHANEETTAHGLTLGDVLTAGTLSALSTKVTNDNLVGVNATQSLRNKALIDPAITKGDNTVLTATAVTVSWLMDGTLGTGSVYRTWIAEDMVTYRGIITATAAKAADIARQYLQTNLATPADGDNTVVGRVTYWNSSGGGFASWDVVYDTDTGLFFPVTDGGTVAAGVSSAVQVGDKLHVDLAYRV